MEKSKPPFTISNEMLSLVSSIMEKIGNISSFDALSILPVLRKQNRIKSVQSSCAIEANSLSLNQVTDIINGKVVIGPEKDIIEIRNALKAYDELERINPFSIDELKRVHKILGTFIIDSAGEFRRVNEGVADENGEVIFIAPPPKMVSSLMLDLFTWCEDNYKTINPLILSSVFHYEFLFIHPFTDGNGRTARLWQTALLSKWKPVFRWIPVENYIKKHQEEYYQAISKSHANGDSNAFIIFMLRMIDITLNNLIKDTNHGLNSNSIYVRKLLDAMPEGIWLTSNEILEVLDLKSKETLRKNYLDPAINDGLIVIEIPDKPTSRNQRYKKQ